MSEEKKKNNIFKSIFKSVKDLDKYEDFALETPRKSFKYFLKIIVIFCVIICAFYTYKIVDNMNDVYGNLKNKLPEFSYIDGNINVTSKETIIIEDYENTFGKIIINTNEINENEFQELQKKLNSGILILKDKCIILSNGTMGQVTYKYSDLVNDYNIQNFTKQDLINYIDGQNIVSVYGTVYFIMFIYSFVLYFISIFVDILILSLLAMIVSRISKLKLKYAPAFSVAIHSITLPLLLNLIYIIINLLTGFEIKYFDLMYNTISYIYVIVAILMIKTDFIDRQLELMKIAKEQEKIKQEIKDKENEEEKEKEEPKEKNKDNKEKKKPKKEGDSLDGTVGDTSAIIPDKK